MFTFVRSIVNARYPSQHAASRSLPGRLVSPLYRMVSSLPHRHWKRLAKLVLGLAIVAYLVYQAQQHESFDEILHQPKNWPLLATSLACVMAAVGLGFVRWFILVREVGLPFTLADALRLGSFGFALNFIGPGGVGGDLFKAVALAREHRSRWGDAVATVVADRLIGLTSLLIVTSSAILLTGMWADARLPAALRGLATLTVAGLGVLLVLGGLLMAPSRISIATANLLRRLPVVGRAAGSLLSACQAMSRRPLYFLAALALGITVHLLLVFSFHLVAVGLPLSHPPLSQQFCVVPLAETAGAIPITPGGLGTTEAALAGLYKAIGFSGNHGVIVALGQRIMMLTVGVMCIGYYLTQRQSVDEALHEADAAA